MFMTEVLKDLCSNRNRYLATLWRPLIPRASITLFHPDAFSPGWFTRVHPCFSCQACDGIRGGALYNSIAQAGYLTASGLVRPCGIFSNLYYKTIFLHSNLTLVHSFQCQQDA